MIFFYKASLMTKTLDNRGYTLVELLVTMLITMVLGGLLFSLYLAASRWVGPWQREIMLEDTMHLIVQRLSADLAYAEQLIFEGDSAWTLVYPSGHTLRYCYQDRTLTRNDRRMHDTSVSVITFRLKPSRSETQFALRRRDRPRAYGHGPIRVRIRVVLQSRERFFDVSTATTLRRPRPWQLLPTQQAPLDDPDPPPETAYRDAP